MKHIAFAAILLLYSIFILLDTFVIPKGLVKAEAAAASAGESAAETGIEASAAGESTAETDFGRKSAPDAETADGGEGADKAAAAGEDADEEDLTGEDDVDISVREITVSDTQVYVADIYLSDPMDLMTAVADDTFGRNVTAKTSVIAEENSAVLAINGDYYGFRDAGYVMRNGYLYRSTPRSGSGNEDLVMYADGTMEIIDESEVSAEELAQNGAVQIFSFGPGLISDGEVTVDPNTEVDQSRRSNPRTAIGMIEPGHYVMVVSDGRTSESEGLTLYELAGVMENLGCTVAYNLDGGGSTTMYYNGEVINNPTTNGNRIKERKVSDIVYIAA